MAKHNKVPLQYTNAMREMIKRIDNCETEDDIKNIRLAIASEFKGKEDEFGEMQKFFSKKREKIVKKKKHTLNLTVLFINKN